MNMVCVYQQSMVGWPATRGMIEGKYLETMGLGVDYYWFMQNICIMIDHFEEKLWPPTR